jgi:hypothetical protein
MFPCDNISVVEIRARDDGDYDVSITSSCKKAERFVEGLGVLNLMDLTNKEDSKIFSNFIKSDMSANCLLPTGIMTAAWVEAGLIARSQTKKGVPMCIEFINE